jgi:hypothetical protein
MRCVGRGEDAWAEWVCWQTRGKWRAYSADDPVLRYVLGREIIIFF